VVSTPETNGVSAQLCENCRKCVTFYVVFNKEQNTFYLKCTKCGHMAKYVIEVNDNQVEVLREALLNCVEAMRRWGAEEDGIPEDAWGAFRKACTMLGLKGGDD
jgi:hypothetical protein